MRMGCSQLNSDLCRMGLVQSPLCSCGVSTEDSFHFFFQCNKYTVLRNEFQAKVISLGAFNLKTVLFGISPNDMSKNQDIFEAVHKYIKFTGRFDT